MARGYRCPLFFGFIAVLTLQEFSTPVGRRFDDDPEAIGAKDDTVVFSCFYGAFLEGSSGAG